MSVRRAFGERLRRHREHRRITLSEIAATTKVGASHFSALERGDCSRWPGGMYNRAFIRAYAEAIGLDPDETAAEFAEYYDPPAEAPLQRGAEGQPAEPVRPALRLSIAVEPDDARKRAARIAALIVVDLLAVVALAATGVLFTATSFWIALSIASIGYHVAARVASAVPRHSWRRKSAPVEAPPEEVPVNSTASTIA